MHTVIAKLVLAVLVLGWAPLVLAHGQAQHVFGTVTAVADDHVVIKTVKGQVVTLGLRPTTTFTKKGPGTSAARPQVGDRLVADVTKTGVKDGEDWVAVAITFSTPQPKAPH